MKFYSTNNKNHLVDLRTAIINGLANDQGLFMPERIPAFPESYFHSLHKKSFQEIALDVTDSFFENEVPQEPIKRIVTHSVSFEAPLVEVDKNIFSLELFHGPTLAFKDFGARFLSQVIGYFAKQENNEITILVATSGDTGSAVANGFLGVPNTRVIVLYPSGKVSEIQEKQFTTLGKNIKAIEVKGTFDDCQRMVKQAFLDGDLRSKIFLTSANSINIARLIPQVFYYFYAWSRLQDKRKLAFSVPSGNFGNLTAGLIAKRMGLPIHHFIASTNVNDIVPHYLATSLFQPKPSFATMSNAMDVGNPSNFARMLDLFRHNHSAMLKQVTGYSFTDDDTKKAMKEVYGKSDYTLDPHGAVGYLGLRKFLTSNSDYTGVFLETAHPAKFREVVEPVLGKKIEVPEPLQLFLTGKKETIPCEASYDSLKEVLLSF